ncbi:hypothetical protein [Rhizobium metallidurans]|uniref:Uncharacterized protein n=1 Tax=Rhizobium metallidurans TaxID=1265931 RepID=A0A7W6CY43_9HYPH|nr:hypothetical protein [Rhizobium metallidurans]MBB3965840.1 hypothetical protein [Rhizobium metallidurans]
MAHEETADCCGQLGQKFCEILFSTRSKQLKSNFAKILGETYPFRGWPLKQAVVYTSDIKREWFGATEGRDNPWLPGPALRNIGHAPREHFAAVRVNVMPSPCRSCCAR